jgi:uncharacterized protein (DUF1684 family)
MVRQLSVRRRLAGVSALSLAVLLSGWVLLQPRRAPAQKAAAPAPTEAPPIPGIYEHWADDLAAWRAAREREIGAPDGWLTLAGMEWLQPGVNSIGAAQDNAIKVRAKAPDHIGQLTLSSSQAKADEPAQATVQLLAPSGGFPADLTIDGKPAKEGQLTVEGPTPSAISWHGVTIVVLRRGERFAVRIKDADSPARAAYKGLNWYAPNPRYRVQAVWTPYTPPRMVNIPTPLGTTLDLPSPGFAEFVLDGKPMNLEPVTEKGAEETLFFILRDVTSDIASYGTARYLHTGLPDHGLDQPGTLMLDFNLLENPPCAYTTYANCPLPPEQNRLPVAIEAGEKLYSPQ